MFDPSILPILLVATSRRRSLVKDVCGCLQQQMFFWGCDAKHSARNLLVRFGMTRLERAEVHSEGSSRYRMAWRGGTLELHSFCAGWYPSDGEGVVFIRNQEHLTSFSGAEPLTPGQYEEKRRINSTTDEMLEMCRPLVEWVAEYESWIESHTAREYRHTCWMRLLSRMGGRPWLPPSKAATWREHFLADPGSTPRAKELLRRQGRNKPDSSFRNRRERIF